MALQEINGAIRTPGRREQPQTCRGSTLPASLAPAPAAESKCATLTDSRDFPVGWDKRKGRMEGQEWTMHGFEMLLPGKTERWEGPACLAGFQTGDQEQGMGDSSLFLGFMEFRPWLYANIATCKIVLLCFCSWSDSGIN